MTTARTRRGMLRGGLALLAGAVGLGTVEAASGAASPSPARLLLHADGVGARAHGRARGGRPQTDDPLSARGRLLHGSKGHAVGTFVATGVAVGSPFHDAPSTVEHHVFLLDDGTIVGTGHAVGGAGTFAVTGGTGRYAGARGTYVATVHPHGRGGDGTATFDFTFTS